MPPSGGTSPWSRRRAICGSPMRTSSCSLSTSRRGWSSIPPRASPGGAPRMGRSRPGARGGIRPEPPDSRPRRAGPPRALRGAARSKGAIARLRTFVGRRAPDCRYLALVRGRPRSRTGGIEAPIGRDRHDPLRRSLDTDTPREAITHFEVERLLSKHSLLSIRLETGRTHQIRVHLAAIDLPVVGDPVYGVPDPDLGRQFLHANRLSFPHPFGGGTVEAESPLPDELQAALARLAS